MKSSSGGTQLLLSAIVAGLLGGCSLLPRPALEPGATAICRSTELQSVPIRWSAPADGRYQLRRDSWCAGVGPAVFRLEQDPRRLQGEPLHPEKMAFVSWNVHVGAGDIVRFVTDLRAGRFSDGRPVKQVVLMIQEAVRSDGVPAIAPTGASAAKWIGSDDIRHSADIDEAARTLDLSVLYVPSMRNGRLSSERRVATDRGNAILSTVPLSSPAAIDLPSDRQRRVAVSAQILVNTTLGETPISVGTVHLNALSAARTLWLFGAVRSRAHQARSLIGALPEGPMILGADLNTWVGPDETAVRLLFHSFPSTPAGSPSSMFLGGFLLDYLFFRLPEGWHARVTRAPEKYGSDHYPLIGWLTLSSRVFIGPARGPEVLRSNSG